MVALVSVVLCTYNGSKFLEAQVRSILNQTWGNLELVICDDCSTDETIHILNSLQAEDKRISIYLNDVNIGLNKNYEKACKLAKGDFIAISDQDDIWREDKIEKLVQLFSSGDITLAHSASVRFSGEPPFHIRNYTKRRLFSGSDVRKLLFFNTVAGHNIMFRKSILKDAVPFPAGVYYDWWLCVIAACKGRVNCTNKVLAFHRHHQHNVTLGKGDEKKQTRSKAEERRNSLEAFLKISSMDPIAISFGESLLMRLKELDGKKFSAGLFFFLMKYARIIFFFKKNAFPLITYTKIAYRLSWAK